MDTVHIIQSIQAYIGEILEYAETAMRYANEVKNTAGVKELGGLIDDLESINRKANELKNKYEELDKLLENPGNFDRNVAFKNLLEKLRIYDNCASIVNLKQKDICYRKFETKVYELASFEKDKENLDAMAEKINNLNSQGGSSNNQKKTLDLIVQGNKIIAQLEIQRQNAEIINTKLKNEREVDEIRQQQHYEKVMNTTFVLSPVDWKNYNWD